MAFSLAFFQAGLRFLQLSSGSLCLALQGIHQPALFFNRGCDLAEGSHDTLLFHAHMLLALQLDLQLALPLEALLFFCQLGLDFLQGNLDKDEEAVITEGLYHLRMAYIAVQKATLGNLEKGR